MERIRRIPYKKRLMNQKAKSSIAFLVYIGEIEDKNGKFHARDNVIDEFGRCQNKFGYNRAIILLEDGVLEPTNIHGIQHVSFPKESIYKIFGDVVAIIRREFSPLEYDYRVWSYNITKEGIYCENKS